MKYATQINESVDFLLEAEKKRGSPLDRDRARFLRLLRTGECNSQASAGAILGLCERHAQRLWQTYRQQGFSKLTIRKSATCASSSAMTRLRLLKTSRPISQAAWVWITQSAG